MGAVDLFMPSAFWHAYKPEAGSPYGFSVLFGAYSAWADKWLDGGALSVRRLFMHKDAYGGDTIYYPEGTINVDGRGEIPTRDVGREIVEQSMAGNVKTLPSTRDQNGNRMWEVERAETTGGAEHILQFPKDLDTEILRGIEIPDDVITAEATGAWQGKQVPMLAFYKGLEPWLTALVGDLVRQLLEPLVLVNFGRAEDFEVTAKSLAKQALEQSGAKEQPSPQGQPGQQPPAPPRQAMSLESSRRRERRTAELSVGEAVLGAEQLVKAARRVMAERFRMASARAPKGGVTINGVPYAGGKFIPGVSQEEVDKAAFKQRKSASKTKRGIGFASPSRREKQTFSRAKESLAGPRHKEMKRKFAHVDHSLEIPHDSIDVIGDWGKSAEGTVLTKYTDFRDFDELRYAMAWKGKLAEQKAVLLFSQEKDGPDIVYLLEIDDTIEGVREILERSGVEERTLSVTEDGKVQAYVVDYAKKFGKGVHHTAQHYGVTKRKIRGKSQLIPDNPGSRQESIRQYDEIIRQYEEAYPDRRHYRPPNQKLAQLGHIAGSGRPAHGPVAIAIGLRQGWEEVHA